MYDNEINHDREPPQSEDETCLDSSYFANTEASHIETRSGCWSCAVPSPKPTILHRPLR